MCRIWLALLVGPVSFLALASTAADARETITIAGTWKLALDPTERGQEILDGPDSNPELCGNVWLPGSIQQQGFGYKPTARSNWVGGIKQAEWSNPIYDPYRTDDAFKMPFWLQPERVYNGAAWYETVVVIPTAWADRRIALHLERTHWVTEVWLDDRNLGTRNSLSTPHLYELDHAAPGEHTLRLRVDNRMAVTVGSNAHSVSDHTQTNWNGVIGRLKLVATPRVYIARVHTAPSAVDRKVRVTTTVANVSGTDATVAVRALATNDHAPSANANTTAQVPAGGTAVVTLNLELGPDAALWSEHSPHPYTLDIYLETPFGSDADRTWFGLRDIATEGTRLMLNGEPIFLRGTLDCAIYPLSGYPPTDVSAWERVFSRVKEFGLNHVRYHSWCPPRAAFIAADRLGVYLQVEGPFWVNQGPKIGDGDPIDQYIYEEIDRILDEYGNHPSFLLMAYGNEPAGRGRGGRFLADWLEHVKAKDPRRLYTSAAGWPILEESQYHCVPGPRIQQWGQGLGSTINAEPPRTDRDYRDFVNRHHVPVVSHEIGQWCAFPNFAEMGKYAGHLKPKNFEVFRGLLTKNGLAHRERDFLMASGRLQLLCYKEEIEAALRTPGFGGFQLLDLHDFPGQGTALVGVLDPFWDPKPYVTAAEYRRFCSPITPLARLGARTFSHGDTLSADIEISHFGSADLTDATVSWTLTTDIGEVLGSGRFGPVEIPAGKLTPVGTASASVKVTEATRGTLCVSIDSTETSNRWDVWLYPARVDTEAPPSVLVTSTLGTDAETALAKGGTVLLLVDPPTVAGGVAFGFSPVFWNTAWTDNQAPHTLGVLVDPKHPVFDRFPTSYHADWQWWELVSAAGAMVINDLPNGIEPLVQPIDTWFRSRRLATLFEASVGQGKLMVCTMDLESNLEQRHAARQLRHSLLRYVGSPDFNPTTQVRPDDIRALFNDPNKEQTGGQ